MHFDDYQVAACTLAEYPNVGSNLVYPALGLAGESGEVADKIKKYWRNTGAMDMSQLTTEQRAGIVLELGDILWYIAALADELDVTLDDVADRNLNKLYDRRIRGVIKSEGDNR